MKRKALSDEIDELKKKSVCLKKVALEQSADELALKAESLGSLTFIAQSYSLRLSAKTNHEEIKRLDDELNDEQNIYSFIQISYQPIMQRLQ